MYRNSGPRPISEEDREAATAKAGGCNGTELVCIRYTIVVYSIV